MQDRRDYFYVEWRGPQREEFNLATLAVRFLVNVAALWFAQLIIRGFDIDTGWALLFGAAIFGLVNAFIRPVIAFISCPLIILTLGLFTLIINALMLGLTDWLAGLLDIDGFEVDGFIAAFLGALVISIVSTILSHTVAKSVLSPLQNP